jgi:phosphatidylserine/phosphatidylglycerophosphate/cardiolipin synthase-like enzyme
MNLFHYKDILVPGVLFISSLYLWKKLYKTYITLGKQYQEQEVFYERHNCTIMYSRKQITGWPPDYKITIDTNNLDRFLEPYLYFIDTAKYTLDIAVMTFTMKQLLNAVQNALKRGVKVRLIANFLSVKGSNKHYNELQKAGIKIALYVDKTENLNNIMHYKYMVKDYNVNNGFVCMGSMNFAGMSTVLNNFEDVTFTSSVYVVEAFHKNFENCWEMIKKDNENIYNKTVLTDAGFLQ